METPFERRKRLSRDEVIEFLASPHKAALALQGAHPAKSKHTPRLQIKITGNPEYAIRLAAMIRGFDMDAPMAVPAIQSIGMAKVETDRIDPAGDVFAGDAIKIYINYKQIRP